MINKIKNWILNRGFVKETIKQVSIKAFIEAQKDLREEMIDETDKKANELMLKKLNDMLSNCDLRKVVSKDTRGIVYIGGEIARDEQLLNLKSEAEYIISTNLWQLLYETPKTLAEKAMFVEGTDLEKQLAKGRTILYTLSTQNNIIEIFKSYQKK
jgi:hypothetical protein